MAVLNTVTVIRRGCLLFCYRRELRCSALFFAVAGARLKYVYEKIITDQI